MVKLGKLFGYGAGGSASHPGFLGKAPGLAADAVNLLAEYEKSGRGWFWTTDENCQIRYISPGVAQVLGVEPEALCSHPFESLFDHDATAEERPERTLQLVLNARKSFSALAVRARADDREVWWSLSGRPRHDAFGKFTGFYGNGEDITEARREIRDASRLAMFDALTGLANRNRMKQLLDVAARGCQNAHRSSALMMCDLDRFKQVNDSMGHAAGDELLKQVAQRVVGVVGGDGEVGRLGGDEFQILFPDLDDRGRLGEIARKIIAVLAEPFSLDAGRCTIGGSVGLAIMPYDGDDADELVSNADLALYAAKEGGRGQFRFFTSELQVEASRRKQLEADLRTALQTDQISLVYQPQVEISSGKVVAVEARLRWEHPDFGEISDSLFIPLAAKSDLLAGLGNWAIRQACADVVQLPGNVRVAVNVTLPQLQDVRFAEVVTQALSSSELSPERLELEVEGGALANSFLPHAAGLSALKMLGVRLVLDDFGSGPISPLNLRGTPFDSLKLAVGLAELIAAEDSGDIAMVRALCDLATACKLDVRANGVEAQDQLGVFRTLGLQVLQGGVYSSPIPFAEVVDAMASGAWVIEPSGPSRYRSDRRTVFRRVGLIHENYRYDVMMRNLSSTGCLIEGLVDVPVGEQFVLDLGDGQLAVGMVKRSNGAMIGLEFELPLVDDGAGGLVTRHRVSRAALAAAAYNQASHAQGGELANIILPRFAQVSGTSARN